jgi:hypothetical protein
MEAGFTPDNRSQDSNASGYTAKVEPGHPDYPERVAIPVMNAVDALSKEWRMAIKSYGYVDCYRAMRRGMSVAEVERRAEANGGFFVL